ncbi:hypothetical protein DRE_00311 [Drechslerella stenobrocha 248]|uniref:Survival protein SurE-like phosphatase/nucleotidase domain-containing protein n=1 Tax=Drechslerella stenobrocha 248 TaxID=1043628 RepID=W7I586_9PEZI|nr:hypothetical protein DRE_00311 [Drechslerella stenobrocha 248]
MHILLTNDDGPPSPSSPYITNFVQVLRAHGHTVSVCIPADQKSWIGKAHIIGHHPKPTFYRPDTDSVHATPRSDGADEWVLINGTPASCTQIGLFHLFKDRGPVDLVLSGPNFGRNTSAVYALSSGTMGGAMEAAHGGSKAISISYSYKSPTQDPEVVAATSAIAARIVDHLYANWPTDSSVDIYSVNLPVEKGVENARILVTHILQNTWGGCYAAVHTAADDEDPGAIEKAARDSSAAGSNAAATAPGADDDDDENAAAMKGYKFRWAPRFSDVEKASARPDAKGSDAWALRQGFISVTPLKANFLHGPGVGGEIMLCPPTTTEASSAPTPDRGPIYAVVDYTDDKAYVEPLILAALRKHLPQATIVRSPAEIPQTTAPLPPPRTLMWTAYEALDFAALLAQPSTALFNAYVIRKALIRKHYLAHTVELYTRKDPGSALARAMPTAVAFEVDYAEFLDDALLEAYELTESLEANEAVEDAGRRQWWILKPGMSDRGAGIRLFSRMEELQAIFEAWEEDEDEDGEGEEDEAGEGIVTSLLRHFVAQEYIRPMLLTPRQGVQGGKRKFHVRTYVLASGGLTVYVYREMLALFAGQEYVQPGGEGEEGFAFDATSGEQLAGHLTNTCYGPGEEAERVHAFWALGKAFEIADEVLEEWFGQVCAVTGEVFRAAVGAGRVHFQPVPNGFEVYGVDFLVGEDGVVRLLEVNAGPDFGQTGGVLRGLVGGLFEEVVRVAVCGFFGEAAAGETPGPGRLVEVLTMPLGLDV